MLFMMILVLTSCTINSHASSASAISREPSSTEIKACQLVVDFVKKTSVHNVDVRNNGKVGNLKFEAFLIIASFRDNFSDDCLLKMRSFYTGSAPGAYLDDLIIKRDKEILPSLEKASKEKSICDPEIYKCHPGTYYDLIERIEKQRVPNLITDNVGDPFQYIPRENIEQRIEAFGDELKRIKQLER